jgi:hypothetical protein
LAFPLAFALAFALAFGAAFAFAFAFLATRTPPHFKAPCGLFDRRYRAMIGERSTTECLDGSPTVASRVLCCESCD